MGNEVTRCCFWTRASGYVWRPCSRIWRMTVRRLRRFNCGAVGLLASCVQSFLTRNCELHSCFWDWPHPRCTCKPDRTLYGFSLRSELHSFLTPLTPDQHIRGRVMPGKLNRPRCPRERERLSDRTEGGTQTYNPREPVHIQRQLELPYSCPSHVVYPRPEP